MKRWILLVFVTTFSLMLGACGSAKSEEVVSTTPVPVYTRSPVQANAVPSQADATVVEADDDAETDAEKATTNANTDEMAAAVEVAKESGPDEKEAQEEESETPKTAPEDDSGSKTPEVTVATEAADETAVEESAAQDAGAAEEDGPGQDSSDAELTGEPAPDSTLVSSTVESSEPVSDDSFAGLPVGIAALMPTADPANGEQLTLTNACNACHNLNPAAVMAGPTWHNLAETAATRVEGQSAAGYIYNSIVNPNDYVVDGYVAGVMLQNYGETLSDQNLADLVSYLLTLQGE